MIERKSKGICEMCDHFDRTHTKMGFPIYRCTLEGERFHKLSTVLYSEPSSECPYFVEHMVEKMNDGIDLRDCHARLGFGGGKKIPV